MLVRYRWQGMLKSSTTPLIVTVTTAVDSDWLELSLGWNSHGSLELNAEKSVRKLLKCVVEYRTRKDSISIVKCTYSPDITISGALTQIRGIFTVFFWDSIRSCLLSSKAKFIKPVGNANDATYGRKEPVVAHGLRLTCGSPQYHHIDSSGTHQGS